MKQKTSLHFVLIVLISILVITGCQPSGTTSETAEPQETAGSSQTTDNNETIFKISSDINLDPGLAKNDDSLKVAEFLYEGLVRLDASGNPQPGIASSWVVSDDELDYIFTIRPNAFFSDGTQITPDIIVDNFNRWFDPASPLHGAGPYPTWEEIFLGYNGEKDDNKRAVSQVDGIQKVDVNTVLLHLNRPVPDTLVYLANPAFAILNTNALTSGYGAQGNTIISSGPYVLSSWTDAGITLSPNSKYWGDKPASDVQFVWQ